MTDSDFAVGNGVVARTALNALQKINRDTTVCNGVLVRKALTAHFTNRQRYRSR